MHSCTFLNFFGWGGGWLGIFLTIAAFVMVAGLISRLLTRKRHNFDRRDSLNILKHRLASGEITPEEYEKLKSVI